MNEGDIFRWSYKEPPDFMPYHCRSCIAIAQAGRLQDTFWMHGWRNLSSDGVSWSFNAARDALILRFVANIADLEAAQPSDERYYADADVVDLRHSNDSSARNFFIRKGAVRSREKMLASATALRQKARSEADYHTRRMNELTEVYRRIESGEPLESILL